MPNARYYTIQRAMQTPAVRAKLRAVRDRMASEAAGIARAEGVDTPIITSEGTRPKGRPYARIAMRADDEFGNYQHKRRRILGRVTHR